MAELEKEEKQEKKRRPRKDRNEDTRAERPADEFVDRVVHVNRVSKTVKGGKRFAFAALVVVGDQKGRVGFAHAKSKEVPDAIKKATERARRHLIRVPLTEGRPLPHDVLGHFGAGNPHNMVRATFDALNGSHSPRNIAARRGKKVGEIVGRRDGEETSKEVAE